MTMDRSTEETLRCAAALGCAVPRVLIELPLHDGKVARISHDPAFAPTMPPCLLRRALVTAERPRWLRDAGGVELRGPFVDVDDAHVPPGVVSFYDGPTANATFATTAPPCVIATWLMTADPPFDTALIDGRVSVDTALGTSLVWLKSNALDPTQLVGVAQWIIQHGPAK